MRAALLSILIFSLLLCAGDRPHRAWDEEARAEIDPQAIRQYLEHMAARPHLAGTPASKAVADYIAGSLRSWGLSTRIEEFEVLLPMADELPRLAFDGDR